MSKQKTRWIFLLALSVLVVVSLSGCQFGEKYPFPPTFILAAQTTAFRGGKV